jgi:ribosomal protein S18 acetylase RimI-like enzyme
MQQIRKATEMSALIQAYIRRNAAGERDTEKIGPFLATFSRRSSNPFLNYAIPDTGAQPTSDDVAALAAAYETRGRLPRLEYLPKLAPEVEAALIGGGFRVDDRLPLMVCPPGELEPQPTPPGIELLTPVTDDEILGMVRAQNEAYGESEPATQADIERLRSLLGEGGLAVLARDSTTGEAAGGAICDVIRDGIGELAGVGVRATFRRRGIAAAITAHLTAAAHRAGAHTVFLTPAGEAEGLIYRRAGYRTIDEVLFVSRRVATP